MTEFLEFENKNTAVERIAAFDDMPNSALLDVQELVALGIGISHALLNFAIGRASLALPPLYHTPVNKDSPDFCNRSIESFTTKKNYPRKFDLG